MLSKEQPLPAPFGQIPFITFLFYFHSESEEKHGAADQMENFELVAEMHGAATGTLHAKHSAVFANQ